MMMFHGRRPPPRFNITQHRRLYILSSFGLVVFVTISFIFGLSNIVFLNSRVLLLNSNGLDSATEDMMALKTTTTDSSYSYSNNENNYNCDTSLNDMVIQLAKLSSPKGSKSFEKNKQILSKAKYFHSSSKAKTIYEQPLENIMTMLQSYNNLKRFVNDTVNSDDTTYGRNQTILIEFYSDPKKKHRQSKTKVVCTGFNCNTIPTIYIQTEQINALEWHYSIVKQCHENPNCVIWDFSETNYQYAQSKHIEDSFVIIPHMFHNRQQIYYPTSQNELLPLKARKNDYVFFGLITDRRKEFYTKTLQQQQQLVGHHHHRRGNNDTTSSSLQNQNHNDNQHNHIFRKEHKTLIQVSEYSNSKVCLIVHAHSSESGGEYHRLSDFKRFGCIPIMEYFDDSIAVDTLTKCAKIKFATLNDIPDVIEKTLQYIDTTPFDKLRKQQLAIDTWWSKGIAFDRFLEDVFGPPTIS